jgi:hypothetical protein
MRSVRFVEDSLRVRACSARAVPGLWLVWLIGACSHSPAGTNAGGQAGDIGLAGGASGANAAQGGAAGLSNATGGLAATTGAGRGGAASASVQPNGSGQGGTGGGDTGARSSAGTSGSAGASAAGGGGASSTGSCSVGAKPRDPFGCKFAFGTNDSGGSLSGYDKLQFMSKWVGYEVQADATLPRCDGCSWLSMNVAGTQLVPVYYAYFIGYLGHANGFADGNQTPNAPNLTTDGAALIRKYRSQIIDMYASYAKQSNQQWPSKPLIWLLEGDFVQYTDMGQKQPLSYTELGQLGADIACAIKSNMPNALVAINQSTWNSDEVTQQFWGAMQSVLYDLVWTTGVANNQGFFEASASASSYNHATATYDAVHKLTGRPLLVDTSFGLSAMGDSWSNADAATLNARIADGVIAVNVTMPPQNYQNAVAALAPMLDAICTP